MNSNKGVRFDTNQNNSKLTPQTKSGGAIKKPTMDEYEDDFDMPANSAGKKNTGNSQKPQGSTSTNNQPQKPNNNLNNTGDVKPKQFMNYEDVQAATQTNRYIIYKFMKKGFSSLSAEDLACTMVNPDFTIDFRKNTGEDWASSYQFKVVERLDHCKYNLQWVTKKQGNLAAANGLDPFFQMVKDGDMSRIVEFIRQSPLKPDEILDSVEQNSKKSPLHIAAGEGNVQMCEFLLHKGARVDARDKLLRTPLHLACQAGHAVVVKLLLDNNSDPYEKDNSGRTAMHYACCSTCVEQLTLLTQHCEDLVHIKDHAGRTPLHYTIFNSMPRQLEMAVKLLNLGADVNALDSDRRTPLHHAAESGKARMIPLLVQRGATTGTKDTLKGMTPIELAATDHIKELIIVHSTPNYVPKQADLVQGLSVEGQQMKIEPEPIIPFDQMAPPKKAGPKINRKQRPLQSVEDSKVGEPLSSSHQYEESFDVRNQALGPAKAWEKVKDQYLPYNIRNYQDKLVLFLKRVQEFGVQSYQHAKKPYLFTGSWMEYVRSMDDLMLQINGAKPNEAVMKVFNILFPYDKPLPQGRGDELSLQGFYTSGMAFKDPNNEDCDPNVLKERLEKEADEDRKRALENNAVEDVRDLLDLKRQLMSLESVNNMHVITLQEKDQKIRELQDQLNQAGGPKAGQMSLESEEQYIKLITENSDLRIQIQQMAEQLEISANRLEQFTNMMQNDDVRKRREMEDMRNYSKVQELEMLKADLEKKLMQERERNRALRFKAGQVFLTTLEKGGSSSLINAVRPGSKKGADGEYYLADDEALMRLMQRIEQLGEPGLQQRLRDAGDPGTDTITKSQFMQFLTKIGLLPPDILSIQRIVGFIDLVDKLKISDIMTRIMERASKRQETELDTLKTLAQEFKSKGYSLQDAFAHLDTNESGTVTLAELQNALKAMKIQIGVQTLKNVLHLFDTNGDNCIQLDEFERQMSKFMGGAAVNGRAELISNANQITGNIIPQQMKQDLVNDMLNERKQKVKFEDFSLKNANNNQAEKQKKEQLIIESLKRGDLAQEMINGELKLQFEEGLDLLTVTGKTVPYIALNIVNYTATEGRLEQTLNSKPCPRFAETMNFSTAVRIPFVGKDKNRISDNIDIQFFMQSNELDIIPGQSVFIGECSLGWKQVLTNGDKWLTQSIPLTDESGKCNQRVRGQVKVFAKWIPAGHPDSKYDITGAKKEGAGAPQVKVAGKRDQLQGSTGSLEVYPLLYVHPTPLDAADRYFVELSLSGTNVVQQSIAKPLMDDRLSINLKDCRTLPVDDFGIGKVLSFRLMTSRGVEIARSQIRQLEKFFMMPGQMTEIRAQKFDLVGNPLDGSQLDDTKKGSLQMRIKFVPTAAAQQPAPVQIQATKQQQPEEITKEKEAADELPPPSRQIAPPQQAKKYGFGKKPEEVKEVKGNAFDMMGEDDANVPMLADDEPPEEEGEEEIPVVENQEADDMGFIGQQPGDANVKKQQTIVGLQSQEINEEEEEEEANKSAEEIQFNMGGAAQVDDQEVMPDDDFQ